MLREGEDPRITRVRGGHPPLRLFGHRVAFIPGGAEGATIYCINCLRTWLRFDQHVVGTRFCLDGEVEERAEGGVTGFSSVEAKDELVEVSLQMFAAQPVVDAAPSP